MAKWKVILATNIIFQDEAYNLKLFERNGLFVEKNFLDGGNLHINFSTFPAQITNSMQVEFVIWAEFLPKKIGGF